MACPFFRPLREVKSRFGRMPLGAAFEGECEVAPGAGDVRLCNFGYARGLCGSFPEGAAADAVRFSVAGSAAGILRVVWIFERDHAPVEHGVAEYRESTREFVEELEGVLGVQARAFVERYLRRG